MPSFFSSPGSPDVISADPHPGSTRPCNIAHISEFSHPTVDTLGLLRIHWLPFVRATACSIPTNRPCFAGTKQVLPYAIGTEQPGFLLLDAPLLLPHNSIDLNRLGNGCLILPKDARFSHAESVLSIDILKGVTSTRYIVLICQAATSLWELGTKRSYTKSSQDRSTRKLERVHLCALVTVYIFCPHV